MGVNVTPSANVARPAPAPGAMVAGDLMLKMNVATAWVATATARRLKTVTVDRSAHASSAACDL